MKESRRELINLAKLEKGTAESIRAGSALSAYSTVSILRLSFFQSFLFPLTDGTRENFLIYTAQRLSVFLEKFFFHNAKDTLALKCRFEQLR